MKLQQQLEQLAISTQVSLAYVQKLYVLEHILQQISLSPDAHTMIVRGSLITRAWVMPTYERLVKDLDLMACYAFDAVRGIDFIKRALALPIPSDDVVILHKQLTIETTWENTALPGHRFLVPVQAFGQLLEVQIDLAYNDPLVPPAIWWQYPTVLPNSFLNVHTIRPELACAWKVQGLFEFWQTKGGKWRTKDLYDIFILLQSVPMDQHMLTQAIKVAFEDRQTPWKVYQRVLDGEFGLSKGSRKAWTKLSNQYKGKIGINSHLEVLTGIRKVLDPIFIQFLTL